MFQRGPLIASEWKDGLRLSGLVPGYSLLWRSKSEEENINMATEADVVAIPEEQGIETHGIERVSPATRTHVRVLDNFTMWFGANLVISTIALGTLAHVV